MITVEWKSKQGHYTPITSHEFKDEEEAKTFVKDNLWMFDHGDEIQFVAKIIVKQLSKDDLE